MEEVKPHILILGGTGFLGRQIADEAVLRGFRVSVFGRSQPTSAQHARAEIVFDTRGDEMAVLRAPDDVDVVINSLASYGRNGESEAEIFNVNTSIPKAIAKYYFGSTSKLHPKLFLNIDTALRSEVSVYAKSKAAFRVELSRISEAPIVGLRLDQFYGPGDDASKFITMLVKKFISKAPEISLSSGLQRRRFLYSRDAVFAIFDVVEASIAKRLTFGAGAEAVLPPLGDERTVKEAVLLAQKICFGDSTTLNFGAVKDRGIETDAIQVPKGFEFLSKRVCIGLEEGIKVVFEAEKKA